MYGRVTVSKKCVHDWFAHFCAGKESVENEPCSSRSSINKTTENVERVRMLLAKDRRLTVIIAEDVGVSKDPVKA